MLKCSAASSSPSKLAETPGPSATSTRSEIFLSGLSSLTPLRRLTDALSTSDPNLVMPLVSVSAPFSVQNLTGLPIQVM